MSFEILMIPDFMWPYLFINLWNADVGWYDLYVTLPDWINTNNYNHIKNQSNQYTSKESNKSETYLDKVNEDWKKPMDLSPSTGTSRKG